MGHFPSGSPEIVLQDSLLGSKLSPKNEAENEGRFAINSNIYYYYFNKEIYKPSLFFLPPV